MKHGKTLVSTLLVGALLVIVGCPQPTAPPGRPPVITDQSSCAAACNNLIRLNCEEGQPILMAGKCLVDTDCLNVLRKPDASQVCTDNKCYTPCVNFCIMTENTGVWLRPACVAKITSCFQVDSCVNP